MPGVNVILLDLPPSASDQEAVGDRYCGRLTACAGFVQALLTSDQVDRVVVHSLTDSELRDHAQGFQNVGRVEYMDSDTIRQTFLASDNVVLPSYTPSLRKQMHLRWLCGSPAWPIVGMTHDLSSVEVYNELLLTLTGRPRPYDAIVCSTNTTRATMQRLLDHASDFVASATSPQLPVIPLGVEMESSLGTSRHEARQSLDLSEEETVFLYFGRLNHVMKADLLPLVLAFRETKNQFGNVKLIIAGGVWGELEEQSVERLLQYASDLDVTGSIRVLTNVCPQTRRELFAAADTLVSPADCFQESFGLVLVESMANGLPVIASDFDGYRDILPVPECGVLIETASPAALAHVSNLAPFEDRVSTYEALSQSISVNVHHLAEAMCELTANPQRRQQMSVAGRREAYNYSWSRVIGRHMELWTELLRLGREQICPAEPSPYWYDHAAIFVDHTSRKIREDSVLELSSLAVNDSLPVRDPPSCFRKEVIVAILAMLSEGSVCVRDLPLASSLAMHYTGYLLKHGLVVLADPSLGDRE